jgi:hypothetical protein
MAESRFVAGPDDMLVRWYDVWIRPSVLATLKKAAAQLPQGEADDVRAALQKQFHGKPCLSFADIPERLRKALHL